MKTALLSIGDELLLGEVVDTNSARIAARLADEGIVTARKLTVGDDEGEIAGALEELARGHDVVIATGGLGPTDDDVTARAVARATGRRLVLNEEAMGHLREFFVRLGREMHPANGRQCLLPAKAELIPNPTGTASGFYLLLDGCLLMFLPGVPSEMAVMLDETVVPLVLERRGEHRRTRTLTLTVFGLSEAEIGARLSDLDRSRPGLTVAYCVEYPVVQVKLRATGEDEGALTALLEDGAALVRERLEGHVVAGDGETIDTTVARLFRETGMTLALAESCTGGLIAGRITAIPGSSAYFLLGAVTYANDAKARLLGVPQGLLAEVGAVSAEVAKAMARGARQLAGSDLALAVTGIAGPEGGSPDKPVGTVFIALADQAGCSAKGYHFRGDRDRIRTITAVTAMDWLRRRLLSH
ncbi:competence/damage-inducible protein A [Geobacter grbiciae]|uniref:competence/damage-inducible protein A n=1 Tax=Geobacter grbiciae TaxID=155042 RepID=UPI001C00ECC0|nr:competence/damage-inducible protein A [Geobacter grbiciae]